MTVAHLHSPGAAGLPTRHSGETEIEELRVEVSGFDLSPTSGWQDVARSRTVWLYFPRHGTQALVNADDLRAALDLIDR